MIPAPVPQEPPPEASRRESEGSEETIQLLEEEEIEFTPLSIINPNASCRRRALKVGLSALLLVCILAAVPAAIYHAKIAKTPSTHTSKSG